MINKKITGSKQWWKLPDDQLPAIVDEVLGGIKNGQTRRIDQLVTSARLYGNLPPTFYGVTMSSEGGYGGLANYQTAPKSRLTYNVVQSAIDTVTSKIAKNKPRPYFLTNYGDWKMQRKAEKLGRFVDGVFYQNDAYPLGRLIFRDAAVFGSAHTYVYPCYGSVKYERVFSGELFVDDQDALYGNPTQLHRVRIVDRDQLIEEFPEHKKEILLAPNAVLPGKLQTTEVSNSVIRVDSWHLRSSPDSDDGLHTVCIQYAKPLKREEYKHDFFPFSNLHWTKRLFGFWGQGAAEQIQNIQREVNTLLVTIQRSMHLMGSFKIAVENSSKMVKQYFNNDLATIIPFSKTPPQYLIPPIVQPEIYAHFQTLKAAAYEIVGISQLSATSRKPEGLDSGKALRVYNDFETERFMTLGQDFEKYFIDLAKITIAVAKDMYTKDKQKNMEIKVPGSRFVETIKWSDVDMEDDSYVLQAFPVSSLSNEPAGRLSDVKDYMQAGLISPRAGRKLLDFPDINAAEALGNAQEDWLNMIFDRIIDQGIYTPPEPQMDLALAKELAIQYIAWGSTQDLPEKRMGLLRDFSSQIDLLVQKAATPPMGAPGMGIPQVDSVSPGQSDLIANQPGMMGPLPQ